MRQRLKVELNRKSKIKLRRRLKPMLNRRQVKEEAEAKAK